MKTVDHDFEIGFFESILKRDPRDTSVIELLANLYTKTGRIDEGLKMDRKMVRLRPENPVAHYNLACSLALKNRKAEAVKSLRTAIENYYRDWEWLVRDPDLKNLHDYPKFKTLLAENSIQI